MSTQIEPVLTLADLDAMPDDSNRYEIIEGELFVSRAPGLIHQTVSLNLAISIRTYLQQNPIGEVWATPGVMFSELSAVIPDLVFVRSDRRSEIVSGDRIAGAPDLVIEIVSPGPENERRDRISKRQLYGKYGVKEYWVVDPRTRTVEVYLLDDHVLKLKATYTERGALESSVLPGFSCKVESVFCIQ